MAPPMSLTRLVDIARRPVTAEVTRTVAERAAAAMATRKLDGEVGRRALASSAARRSGSRRFVDRTPAPRAEPSQACCDGGRTNAARPPRRPGGVPSKGGRGGGGARAKAVATEGMRPESPRGGARPGAAPPCCATQRCVAVDAVSTGGLCARARAAWFAGMCPCGCITRVGNAVERVRPALCAYLLSVEIAPVAVAKAGQDCHRPRRGIGRACRLPARTSSRAGPPATTRAACVVEVPLQAEARSGRGACERPLVAVRAQSATEGVCTARAGALGRPCAGQAPSVEPSAPPCCPARSKPTGSIPRPGRAREEVGVPHTGRAQEAHRAGRRPRRARLRGAQRRVVPRRGDGRQAAQQQGLAAQRCGCVA